jgi:hypothetical protein
LRAETGSLVTSPSGAGDVDVFRDALKKAARALEDNLRVAVIGMSELRDGGTLTTGQLGDWDASRQLCATVDAANREILLGYESFLAQYQASIDALHQTAAMYERAEQDSDIRLNAVRPGGHEVRSMDL